MYVVQVTEEEYRRRVAQGAKIIGAVILGWMIIVAVFLGVIALAQHEPTYSLVRVDSTGNEWIDDHGLSTDDCMVELRNLVGDHRCDRE